MRWVHSRKRRWMATSPGLLGRVLTFTCCPCILMTPSSGWMLASPHLVLQWIPMNVRFRRREDTAGREWLRQSLGGIPGQLHDWLHDQEESLFLEEGGTTEHGGGLGTLSLRTLLRKMRCQILTDGGRRHEPKSEQRGTTRLGNPSRYERGSQGDSGSEGWGDKTCSLPWRGCRLLLRHIWPVSYFCLSSLHLVVDWLPSVWEELRGGLLLSAHQYRETDWAPPFFCDAEGWKKLMKGAKCSLLWL